MDKLADAIAIRCEGVLVPNEWIEIPGSNATLEPSMLNAKQFAITMFKSGFNIILFSKGGIDFCQEVIDELRLNDYNFEMASDDDIEETEVVMLIDDWGNIGGQSFQGKTITYWPLAAQVDNEKEWHKIVYGYSKPTYGSTGYGSGYGSGHYSYPTYKPTPTAKKKDTDCPAPF